MPRKNTKVKDKKSFESEEKKRKHDAFVYRNICKKTKSK
jgi:hypothetical protein